MVVRACVQVAKKDAFGFLYCSHEQSVPLKKLFEENNVEVTVCVVARPSPNSAQLSRKGTRAPLNVTDHALHLVFGNPTWANYGSKNGKEVTYLSNLILTNFRHRTSHPFEKSTEVTRDWIRMFSAPQHHVLEAFAGSCPSIYGAVDLGRNITLVEKCEEFVPLFEQQFDLAVHRIEVNNTPGGIPAVAGPSKKSEHESDNAEENAVEDETPGTKRQRLTDNGAPGSSVVAPKKVKTAAKKNPTKVKKPSSKNVTGKPKAVEPQESEPQEGEPQEGESQEM